MWIKKHLNQSQVTAKTENGVHPNTALCFLYEQPNTHVSTFAGMPFLPLFFLFFCFVPPLFSGYTYAENDRQQLQNIQQDIVEQEKNVIQQQQQRKQLQQQLREQDQAIAKASAALAGNQSSLERLDKELSTLMQSNSALQQKQQKQQVLLARQLDLAFRQKNDAPLALIFTGEENARSERILAYLGYLSQARQKNIQLLEETQQQLDEQKKAINQRQTQQRTLLTQQKNEQATLQKTRLARQNTLKQLEISLKKDQQQLEQLKQNQNQLQDKIIKAEQAAKARAEREAQEAAQLRAKEQEAQKTGTTYNPTTSERALMARTGGLGRPAGQYRWPTQGQVLHRFGEQQNSELLWKGMVIATAEGSDVKAIAAGRVLLADWLQGYGLVIVLDHGQGDMSLYGYNQNSGVKVGNQIEAGQTIASVGNSGGQEQPALYFEIRRQGQAVNPQAWLGK